MGQPLIHPIRESPLIQSIRESPLIHTHPGVHL